MTFHDPQLGRGGQVLLLTGPFGEPERRIVLDQARAIDEVIAGHQLTFRLPTIALLNGEPVLRGEWAVRMVRETDTLAFVAVPRGGGNNTGKQVAGLLAALALTIAAPGIGTAVAGALFGGSAIAASIVSAAVIAGGSLLLNAVLPATSDDSAADSGKSVFSVSAAGNEARPLQPLPVLYGLMRYAPPFASRSYSEFAGNDQFLYQLFCVTAGKADVTKVEIGTTAAWDSVSGYAGSFSDLTIQIVQPGQSVTLFPANVVTSTDVAGQSVPNPSAVLGPFVVNASGTTIDKIAVDFAFPGGLFTVGSGRTLGNRSAKLRAEYQQIDNSGAPIGGWSDIFRETITLATRTPQRLTRNLAVTAARYQVRFSAEQAFASDDTVAVDATVWAGLRGYLTGFVTPANCTLLGMKIRANEQLSEASASEIFVTAQRYLPTHPSTSWTAPASTRSIAWAAADLLRDNDYGLGLLDNQIDVDGLKALDATWAGRTDSFNYLFQDSSTAKDALTLILRAGRAAFVRLGGQIGFNRLEAKSLRRAAFTLRNVVRGSFSHKLVLFDDDNPDSINGNYLDETVWTERQVLAQLASVGSDAPADVDYPGITNHDQAWREAVTDAAVNAYQREFVSFTAEWEGKLLTRGEPILVMHPFLSGVQQASAVGISGAVITLDRDATDPGGSRYVIARGKDGAEWGPCLVSGVSGRVWTLDGTDKAAVEASMGTLASLVPGGSEERMHILVCAGTERPFNGLVVSATPRDDGKVDIVSVIDAPEVYAADGTETKPSPWATPTLPDKVPERPVVSGLYAELRAGFAGIECDAVWLPAAGATRGYVAQVSYDAGGSWTHLYEGSSNRFTRPVQPQASSLRVAGIGKVQGPWITKSFTSGDVPDPRLGGEEIYPISLSELAADMAALNARLAADLKQARKDLVDIQAFVTDAATMNFDALQALRQSVTASIQGVTAGYTSAIVAAVGPGSAQVVAVQNLNAALPGKADASVVVALSASVTSLNGTVTAQSVSITSLQSTVNDPVTGLAATVTGLSSLSTSVTSLAGQVVTNASAITALGGQLGNTGANTQFQLDLTHTPSAGWIASAAVQVAATAGGIMHDAGAYFESKAGASRVVLSGDSVVITDGTNINALFTAGTTFINSARINSLTVTGVISTSALFVAGVAIRTVLDSAAASDRQSKTQGSGTIVSGSKQEVNWLDFTYASGDPPMIASAYLDFTIAPTSTATTATVTFELWTGASSGSGGSVLQTLDIAWAFSFSAGTSPNLIARPTALVPILQAGNYELRLYCQTNGGAATPHTRNSTIITTCLNKK